MTFARSFALLRRAALPVLVASCALSACAEGDDADEIAVDPSSTSGGSGWEDAKERVAPSAVTTRAPLVERVLVFAIDGATWKLADPLMADGRMPNFARLVAQGARADLETLQPTVSPAIWTTIATGVLPKRHGILGFEGVPGKTMTTLPNARMRRVKAFWDILTGFGHTVGILGWWATWPADELGSGSWLVSDRVPYSRMEAAIGRGSLTPEDTYPPDLLDAVVANGLVEKPNDIAPEVVEHFLKLGPDGMEELLAAKFEMGSYLPEFKFVYQSDRSTLKIALHLLRERRVDLTAVYMTGIDTVSHLFWHFAHPDEFPRHRISGVEVERYGEVIAKYYELTDQYLGRLLEAAGENTTVLIVSDHGFGGTGNLPWSGGHGRITPGAPIAPPGVLLLSGPAIASGVRLTSASVLDIAPTLLHLFGVPASDKMRGRVLTGALTPDAAETLARIENHDRVGRPRAAQAMPVDPEGDSERLERLRALGYIE